MQTNLRCFHCILSCMLIASLTYAQPEIQKKIQTDFILSEDGATIQLEEGTFAFSSSLSMQDKKNITIKGKGIDKTILSFKGQSEGAEGLRISNGQNIVIEDMTIQDTKGDCIKTMNVNGITFRNVKVEWTGGISKDNGSYGLYPVQCENVLIEKCTSIGASDAGIYVGQSKYIIVRNCVAYHNVAGIEIENSLMAEVYDNEAYDNTGGILVFDLPDLIQKKGGNVRVYRNHIHNNNLENFAPKGNIVAKVPDGTGMMILATNNVEIFDNKIINNNTLGVGIISYYITENEIKDADYYPYPSNINIHDNTFERERVSATKKGRLGLMFQFKLKFKKDVPDIIWDGIVDKDKFEKGTNMFICIKNNQNAQFANIDAANNFKNIVRDASNHDCLLPSLKSEK